MINRVRLASMPPPEMIAAARNESISTVNIGVKSLVSTGASLSRTPLRVSASQPATTTEPAAAAGVIQNPISSTTSAPMMVKTAAARPVNTVPPMAIIP